MVDYPHRVEMLERATRDSEWIQVDGWEAAQPTFVTTLVVLSRFHLNVNQGELHLGSSHQVGLLPVGRCLERQATKPIHLQPPRPSILIAVTHHAMATVREHQQRHDRDPWRLLMVSCLDRCFVSVRLRDIARRQHRRVRRQSAGSSARE